MIKEHSQGGIRTRAKRRYRLDHCLPYQYGFKSWLCTQPQLPGDVQSGGQWVTAAVTGSLLAMCDLKWVPGSWLSLAQARLLKELKEHNSRQELQSSGISAQKTSWGRGQPRRTLILSLLCVPSTYFNHLSINPNLTSKSSFKQVLQRPQTPHLPHIFLKSKHIR